MSGPGPDGQPPTLTTIVLAAGGSSRMAGGHKLLEIVAGRPVVAWAVAAPLEAGLGPVLVVTGDRAAEIAAALPPEVTCLPNRDWRSGMATSIARGAAAVSDRVDAFAIALADMPLLRGSHYLTLARAWTQGSVVVPTWEDRAGHPVVWSREFAGEMAGLEGDRGARSLLERHTSAVVEVPMGDAGVVIDVDKRDQLEVARTLLERSPPPDVRSSRPDP